MKEKSGQDFDIRHFEKLKRPRLMTIIALLDEVLSTVQAWRRQKKESLGVRATTIRVVLLAVCLMIKAIQHILMVCIDENTDKHSLEHNSIAVIDNDDD